MSRHALFALALLLGLPAARPAGAQCPPAACTGTHAVLTFEGLAPGTSVEGPGAVHPDLRITSLAWPLGTSCPPGSAAVIEEGNLVPFLAYDTSGFTNGCLNGTRGFGDPGGCALDYDFTFASGFVATCFSLRMLDYGDFFPFGGTLHQVTLSAYDATSTLVAQDVLSMTGGEDGFAGDACLSQAGAPGNHLFTVSGPGIVRVELRFDGVPDPNIGFDDVSFCLQELPVRTGARTWGAVKTIYRD